MPNYAIFLILIGFSLFMANIPNSYGPILGHPLEFWETADIILDGTVLSTTNIESENLVQHDIKVEQYFKNKKSQQMITAFGPTAFNEKWFYPTFFEKGDRALFYLKKIDNKYIILEHSIVSTKECSPRDMIGLSTLPGEPIGRGGPTLFFDPYQTCNGFFYSPHDIAQTLTPLQQIKAGIHLEDINCEKEKVLIQKYDESPACVKSDSVSKLIKRGWAKPQTNVIIPDKTGFVVDVKGEQLVRRGVTHTIEVNVSRDNLPVEDAWVVIRIEDYGEDIIKEFDGYTDQNGYFEFSWEIPKSFDDIETLLAFVDVTDDISAKTILFKFQVYCLPGEVGCKAEGN